VKTVRRQRGNKKKLFDGGEAVTFKRERVNVAYTGNERLIVWPRRQSVATTVAEKGQKVFQGVERFGKDSPSR